MAEHRPFPPSARRHSLARAAGLTAASPVVVGAVAITTVALALAALGPRIAAQIGDGVVAAIEGSARLPSASVVVSMIASVALPILGVAALAALIAHVAQTRAVWIPRRHLRDAPAPDPQRAVRASLDLASGIVVGGIAFGWLWSMAPQLANLARSPHAGALVIASFLAALAIAWVALGTIDALVRYAQQAGALRMTAAEHRADARDAGADPMWRRRRSAIARERDAGDAVAGASLVLLGDDVAIAVAWDPIRRPVPTRTIVGRGPRATQILGLARRHAIAVHRDAALAIPLGSRDGRVPEVHWPRLAEIIAATRGRTRS